MEDARDRRSVEERREQLIDAAIQVLAEEGLDRATTRRITERAGLALGAFHYAFRSKDELLESVIERFAAGLDGMAGEVPETNGDVGRATRQLIETFWSFAQQSPELQLAQYELTLHALRDPAMRPLARKQYDTYTESISRALGNVADAPPSQERDDLARYIAATLDGLVLQGIVDDDPDAARRRLELHLRALPMLVRESRMAGDRA